MKNGIKYACLLLAFAGTLLILNCRKADTQLPSPPNPPKTDPLQEKVSASITGRVIDENAKPVQNANVLAGGISTITDINGYFRISNVQLSKNAGAVMVSKEKYFTSSRTFFTAAGSVNNVEIKLIPKTSRGSFQSANGAVISIENGSTVSFPAAAIVNAQTKAAYSGLVTVYGAYLSPGDANLQTTMPGNLMGVDSAGDLKLLQTFGMVVVELEGSSGEKLNLDASKGATISMPIASNQQSVAPSTIPLWYFSDTTGVWKGEGIATKQGSNYIGTVKHFSFWNCDKPIDFVNLTIHFQNQNQQSLSGYQVQLKSKQDSTVAYGTTDTAGNVTGAVPKGVALEMNIYSKCKDLVLTKNIGPFTGSTDLGAVSISTNPASTITISGAITNCQMAAVTNGYVDFTIDGAYYRTGINNGNYSITIDRCSNSAASLLLRGTDAANVKTKDTTFSVTAGSYVTNIRVCDALPQAYIFFSIGANNINFSLPGDSITTYTSIYQDTLTSIWATSLGSGANSQNASMYIRGAEKTGDIVMSLADSIIVSQKAQNISYSLLQTTFHISEYGPRVTGYIAGSFSGNFIDQKTRVATSGTCNFRVRRSN
ncbi:MAG: carboxypeptidase-like regulatory domain-containing protein [Chitinophagaceae bacterium]